MKESISGANERLLNLIEKATSPFQCIQAGADLLLEHGFTELQEQETWHLRRNGKYFVKHHDSSMIAFTIGENFHSQDPFRIAAAHTDFPGLRIKPNPDIREKNYSKINVEVYGGAILNTWLDRPLSAAGRVVLKSDHIFFPKMYLIDLKEPLFLIPNLAIHQNREVNKGVELKRQVDMIPLFSAREEAVEGEFLSYLAETLNVDKTEILDYELNLYPVEKGMEMGNDRTLLSSPRLDNQTSVSALLHGIIHGERASGINVIALFDHEEIGSRTKQGAGSMLLSLLLEKIYNSMGIAENICRMAILESILLSVDVAHAHHPNQTGKSDPTNRALLNHGVVIKEASSQSYLTDSEAVAIVEQICLEKKISYQKYVNRSDGSNGSTLGSIATSFLPMRGVDLGVPILAMHSARELMGSRDQEELEELILAFFSL